MRYIGSFAIVLTLACGPEFAPEGSNQTHQRIIGGAAFAGLGAVGSLAYFGQPHCTATVIAPTKLLTAAHCVDGVDPSGMQFVVGASFSAVQAVVDVASVHAHPAYSAAAIENDIAIVNLVNEAPVEPMPVEPSLSAGDVGSDFLFVGYGVNDGYSQTGSGTKRAVWMEVGGLSPTTFSYAEAGKNTCNGDSGGPAFVERGGELFLAGVTSYGDKFCTQYGVNTRADAYLDFLGVDGAVAAESGCAGETFTGRCEENSVIWCEDDAVLVQSCGAEATCGFDTNKGWYACQAP